MFHSIVLGMFDIFIEFLEGLSTLDPNNFELKNEPLTHDVIYHICHIERLDGLDACNVNWCVPILMKGNVMDDAPPDHR